MKQVTCKKLGSTSSLTVRKTYDVIEETDNRYIIVNDRGIQANYGKNLFNEPIEVPEPVVEGIGGGGEAPRGAVPGEAPRRRGRPSRADIAARVGAINEDNAIAAVPAAAPIRVVDSIEINTEVESDEGHRKFSIACDFGGNFVKHFDSGWVIETYEIASSCGIKSLAGLEALKSSLDRFKTQLQGFIDANRANFVLGAEINFDEMMSEITKAVVQDLVASYQGGDIEAGIIILSTTEESIDEMPALRAALTSASSGTISVHNPNSGNDIVMWNIAVEA